MSETIAGVKPGLRVFVSAGAAGIGRAIADTLAAHARGCMCATCRPRR